MTWKEVIDLQSDLLELKPRWQGRNTQLSSWSEFNLNWNFFGRGLVWRLMAKLARSEQRFPFRRSIKGSSLLESPNSKVAFLCCNLLECWSCFHQLISKKERNPRKWKISTAVKHQNKCSNVISSTSVTKLLPYLTFLKVSNSNFIRTKFFQFLLTLAVVVI